MSIIDNYGEFELPEEKIKIEVVENPIEIVLSCYDSFKKKTQNSVKTNFPWFWSEEPIEFVYKEALKVFEEKAELKTNFRQTEVIMEVLRKKAKYKGGTDIFLSALINSTKINTLFIDEFSYLDMIGYFLKKDKTIILGPKTASHYLGSFAEGNTINKGILFNHQGSESIGGNHINLRSTYNLGYGASGGNHINQGYVEGSQGAFATGGNHINQGRTSNQAEDDETLGSPPTQAKGGNHVNLGKTDFYFEDLVIDLSQKQNHLKTKLEEKLSELDFLKTEEPEKLVQLVNAYDWNKFDKNLNEICEKIKEVYGKK